MLQVKNKQTNKKIKAGGGKKTLNETKISNLSDKEFQVMDIKMFTKLK